MTTLTYEILFINSVSAEEIYNACIEKYEKLIESAGGIINKVDKWGVKRLAYEINNQNNGYYTLVEFSATKELIKEIDRKMKIDENVLRHMIIRKGC